MSSTKIINIARDDRFEEILSLFKSASATEVIFVLPKNAKAFNREANVAALRDAAEEGGKKVSLLCPNPRVVALASAYGFEILPDRSSTPRPKKPKAQLAQAPVDDDSLDRVRDDSDAFEKDVVVPSDSGVSVDTDDDELDGMHEEDEQAKDLDETLTTGEDALVEEPTEEQLGEIEEEAADDIVSDTAVPTAHLASATARRQIDGVAHAGHQRKVTPQTHGDPRGHISVHRHHQSQRKMADIAQVWHSEQAGTNMWSDIPVNAKPRLAGGTFSWAKRLGVVGGTIAVVAVGTFLYFGSGSAQVFITPVHRDLDLAIRATISDGISEVDAISKRLPGQIFNVEKTVSQDFPASGEKDVAQKAKGKVTVSNGLSTAQTLIATTRFQSASGHIYRSLRTISVPAAATKAGVSTPGKIEVEVIADKPGKEYNLEPGAFTIPAFKEKGETERFQKVTAQSTVAFTGGVNGKAKVVTEVDYQTARDTVTTSARSTVLELLKGEIGELVAPQPSVIVKAVETSAQVDQAVDTFTVSGTGAIKTVGVKKEDLEKLVAEAVKRDQHLVVLPDKLEITLGEGQFSETSGLYEIAIMVKGKGYDMVDEEKLVGELMGRTEPDIRAYLKSAEGVASARVVLSPFWVRKMPQNKEKVTLEFQYE